MPPKIDANCRKVLMEILNQTMRISRHNQIITKDLSASGLLARQDMQVLLNEQIIKIEKILEK